MPVSLFHQHLELGWICRRQFLDYVALVDLDADAGHGKSCALHGAHCLGAVRILEVVIDFSVVAPGVIVVCHHSCLL